MTLHAELFGVGELRSGILACYEVVGLLADAAADRAAEVLDPARDLRSAEALQPAGDDEAEAIEDLLDRLLALLGLHGDADGSELLDDGAVGLVGEVGDDGLGDLRADGLHGFEVFLSRVHQRVDVREVPRKKFGHLAADMLNADRDKDAGERALLRGLDGGQQVCDACLAEAFQLQQVVLVQSVEVGDLSNETLFEQDGRLLDAQPFDVHRALADEVLQKADELRGAGGIDAEVGGLSLGADDRLSAARAGLRHLEGSFVAGALADDRRNDLWDDLPRPLDDHPVADAEVLGRDVVGVVEGGLPDRDAVDVDGFEDGVGVDAPVLPTLTLILRSCVVA